MELEVGDPAPDFALPDADGASWSLTSYRGRTVVLYFYPKDDTPGCAIEACEFRDSFASIRADGAEVWGISPDNGGSHAKFRAKFELPFTLLSDDDAAVATAYGAWVEKTRQGQTYMGVQRSTFLVGPDSHIAHAWPAVTPEGHAAEVRSVLAAAKAQAAS